MAYLRTEFRTEYLNYGHTRRHLELVDSDSEDAYIEPASPDEWRMGTAALCCIPFACLISHPLDTTTQKVVFVVKSTAAGATAIGTLGFFAGLPAGGFGCAPGLGIGAAIGAVTGLTISTIIVIVKECSQNDNRRRLRPE